MSAVPDDFPTPAPFAAVPGAQQKLSCVQVADGRLAPSGGTRAERHARCAELATWAAEFLNAKMAKPKHSSLPLGVALEKLRLTLRAEFPDLSVDETAWILSRVRRERQRALVQESLDSGPGMPDTEADLEELRAIARGDIE